MRQRELRRLFRRLVIATAPVPLGAIIAACSGQTDPGNTAGTGGFFPGTRVMLGGSSATGGSGAGGASMAGIGGFLGTRALVGGSTGTGGENTAGASTAGTGGFFPGTRVMVGGSPTAAGSSSIGVGGFLGTVVMVGGAVSTGRRPDGLAQAQSIGCDELGRYFSEVAHLEAASVAAFRALGRQLGVYGAPTSLRRATRRAARDEIRHARITRALAVRFGGRYVPPQVTAKPAPSLETIARENAAEGCVRETYGALIATYQAQVATDPQVRRVMREIARDETRHAALAWRIARWADKCLDPQAKQRVRAARQASIETLFGELDYQVSQSLTKVAGVPSGAQARQLAGALSSELWA